MSHNAFESGVRKVIPAVLVYVRNHGKVLMIHRNSSTRGSADYHQGKWNGLGGKCELDESPIQAARREVREESGFDLAEEQFHSLGVLQFPNFKPHRNEDWIVFVFVAILSPNLAKEQCPEPPIQTDEGDLHWIPEVDLPALNLWPGDRYFIPYLLQNKPFVGTIWYQGKEVANHWIQCLTNHSY